MIPTATGHTHRYLCDFYNPATKRWSTDCGFHDFRRASNYCTDILTALPSVTKARVIDQTKNCIALLLSGPHPRAPLDAPASSATISPKESNDEPR